MTLCLHTNFAAAVEVTRLQDAGRPLQFMASVKVQCDSCKREFRFVGMRAGLALAGARCSADHLEARLAIEPAEQAGDPR
jgi:hypothetical protein